jgi:uncharacterized protein (TIGR00299 family) protein
MLAYFDCFSGISGDMTLGALLDLGVPLKWLNEKLAGIPLQGFEIKVSAVYRSGIRANQVTVRVDDPQQERNYGVIKSIIENSPLPDAVKSNSIGIFSRLAAAESQIHGCPPEEVHFHEVGGVDAMVDIIGTALGIQYLGIDEIAFSAVPLGKGFVECRHGRLPVPAPATVALLKEAPVYGTDIEHELVTPTGAAITAGLAQSFGPLPRMHIQTVGYGAGARELESRPNLLRVMLGQAVAQGTDILKNTGMDEIWIVEASIDDMNPEMFGFVMDRLFDDGALDVHWIPVYMKKNRPGTVVQVLSHAQNRDVLVHRLLSETTTLGVRYYEARRRLLARDQVTVDSAFGSIAVKRIKDPAGNVRLVPEFEICKKIAIEKDLPLRVVYDTIVKDLNQNGILKS